MLFKTPQLKNQSCLMINLGLCYRLTHRMLMKRFRGKADVEKNWHSLNKLADI